MKIFQCFAQFVMVLVMLLLTVIPWIDARKKKLIIKHWSLRLNKSWQMDPIPSLVVNDQIIKRDHVCGESIDNPATLMNRFDLLSSAKHVCNEHVSPAPDDIVIHVSEAGPSLSSPFVEYKTSWTEIEKDGIEDLVSSDATSMLPYERVVSDVRMVHDVVGQDPIHYEVLTIVPLEDLAYSS